METISSLQHARYQYKPKVPKALQEDIRNISVELGEQTESVSDETELKQIFENTYGQPIATCVKGTNKNGQNKFNVGVILSGGQAPGGHNVIAGLFDGLKNANPESKLFGFIGGPSGILEDKAIEFTPHYIDSFRNTGGFDIIGSGRTKLEKEDQFEKTLETCKKRNISAIVIIGGDDSNTNAALLAEFFKKKGEAISVIGVPKTIDGDLKGPNIEASFGFDTATKTYSELIGNICRDANSAQKYWHFIKLMGRSASHICLECALQTQPNHAIISEEVEEKQISMDKIVQDIVDIVKARSENGKNFGVVLVPEGLIEFVPEMKKLISELNDLMARHAKHFDSLRTFEDQSEWLNKNLSKDSSYVFSSLPNSIRRQLLMDRDPHGNVQVSRIETEQLIIEMVRDRLNELKNEGNFDGKFVPHHHFFGYEGRCAFPSNFDADYCYSLGLTALILATQGLTGYIAGIKNLSKSADQWKACGIPLTTLMNMEQRKGKRKPVIRKGLVDLKDKPFISFAKHRDKWAVETKYLYPGAIQYYGPDEVCNKPTKTIMLEHGDM